MITILTPTYNRAYLLNALYESLLAQDDHSFEWLIVDDGSTDETSELVERFQQDSVFPIVYERQENGGKHTAINTGIRLARGDWVFIVDSDDVLTADAVASIGAAIQHSQGETSLVGVSFRRAYMDGKLMGRPGLSGVRDMSPTQASAIVQGDLAYVFKREAMVAQPFPVYPGEKFVPELYIWNRIGDLGVVRYYLDKAIYRGEYLPDGYTHNFKRHLQRNPRGFLQFYWHQIGRETSWLGRLKCLVRSAQCLFYWGRRKLS
ncbi:hypothetical protein AAV94_11605 [Lampropedia cohaerens]|uniref:Glycosyltransferase 2-like domain-containing protein n=1 Tax=Lampropedia cohaerens TaxID=1610491 RepID=A0A0U1PXF4_9BURK|nr:glycosyltransferase family 2 protein [Lampropedia cohaerens]KKW67228.1 hypothetical protein AAV94_11605 [Lampropedia cohaerens]